MHSSWRFPTRIYYPADATEKLSRRIAASLPYLWGGNQEPVQLRRYFITTVSELRKHARENHTQMGDKLVRLVMGLNTAQYVWVVEYCSVDQWENGGVAARAIVDATASPRDPMPLLLLHDEDLAFLFDRSSAKFEVKKIRLGRSGIGRLPRFELNLRPVRL